MMRPTQQKMGITTPRTIAMMKAVLLNFSNTGLLEKKKNSYVLIKTVRAKKQEAAARVRPFRAVFLLLGGQTLLLFTAAVSLAAASAAIRGAALLGLTEVPIHVQVAVTHIS